MNLSIVEAVQNLTSHPLILLVFALGVFGWWRLVAVDTILDTPRNWFWHKFPYEGYQIEGYDRQPESGTNVFINQVWYTQKGRWISELIRCPWCLGWWIGALQFLAYLINPTLTLLLALIHFGRVVAALCHHKLD